MLTVSTSFQDRTMEGWNPLLYVNGVWFQDVAESLGAHEGIPVLVIEHDGDDVIKGTGVLSWRKGVSLLAEQWVAVIDDRTILSYPAETKNK